MRKVLFTMIALVAIGSFTSIAQTAKFAHVYSEKVLDSIQSYKNIIESQEQIYVEAEKQSKKLQSDIQRIQRDAQAGADTLTEFDMYLLQSEVEEKQQKLYELEQYAQGKLQRVNQLLQQLMDVYRKAVKEVADKYGYTYVFDGDSQVLYASPKGNDITDEVRTVLLRMDKEAPILE
ncbi:MAG: OmpH family outer membrane protein [Crocinitomicaceae bacterium]